MHRDLLLPVAQPELQIERFGVPFDGPRGHLSSEAYRDAGRLAQAVEMFTLALDANDRGTLNFTFTTATVSGIGTGATAIQCIPHLGESAKHLYVFQRTPSSVDVRANRPTDPEWAQSLEPGWQRRRIENFSTLTSGAFSVGPADGPEATGWSVEEMVHDLEALRHIEGEVVDAEFEDLGEKK